MTRRAYRVARRGYGVARRVCGALVVSAGVLAAQTTDSSHVPLPPHRISIDSMRVHAWTRAYEVRLVRDSDTTGLSLGTRTERVDTLTYGTTPAWRVTSDGGRGVLAASDTLIVSRGALKPLRWTSTLGVSHIAIEIPGDTLYGAIQTPFGARSLVAPLPGDAIVGDEALDLLLSATPLNPAWRDSANTLQLDATGAASRPVVLAVERSDRIDVHGHAYDAWVVTISDASPPALPQPEPAPDDSAARDSSVRRDSTEATVASAAAPTALPTPSVAVPTPLVTLWVDERSGAVLRSEQPVARLRGRIVRELSAPPG